MITLHSGCSEIPRHIMLYRFRICCHDTSYKILTNTDFTGHVANQVRRVVVDIRQRVTTHNTTHRHETQSPPHHASPHTVIRLITQHHNEHTQSSHNTHNYTMRHHHTPVIMSVCRSTAAGACKRSCSCCRYSCSLTSLRKVSANPSLSTTLRSSPS